MGELTEIKPKDLEFNIMVERPGGTRGDRIDLQKYNIFHHCGVMKATMLWAAGKALPDRDLISWCFGDLRGATEFEVMVSSWPPTAENNARKYSAYELYIEPNEAILRELVGRVSSKAAKAWLKEQGRR